jgi:voltage-gated potassium channel
VSKKPRSLESIAARENSIQRWEARSAIPLAICAALFLGLWAVQVLVPMDQLPWDLVEAAILLIWAIFIFDFLIRLYFHANRKAFLKSNVIEIIALLLPAFRFLRVLRVITAVGILTRVVQSLQARVNLYIAIVLPMLVFAGSLGIYEAEHSLPQSNIKNFGDAFWWACETIFTVGYGDLFPVTAEGKLIAVILMMGGVAMISVVTANLAGYFLSQQRNVSNRDSGY